VLLISGGAVYSSDSYRYLTNLLGRRLV